MHSVGLIALVASISLVCAACGARLSAGDRQGLARAAFGEGTGGGGNQSGGRGNGAVGQGSQTGGTGSPAKTGSKLPNSGSTPHAGQPGSNIGTHGGGGSHTTKGRGNGHPGAGSSVGPSSATSSAPSAGAACPSSGSDVGLTGSTIDLGTIADLTGPVSGLFEGAVQGVETFANYVNNTGGLCGRSVHFDIADGQTNCTTNENDAQSLIAKDFALVGSFSLYDNCAATIIKQHPTVSDLHTGLNPSAIAIPNHFDIAAGTAGALTGPFAYWAHEFPTQVKNAGTIAEDVPSALAEQANFVHAAESTGWKFIYSDNASPTASNFTSEFQTMCLRDHVQLVYIETETAQNAATMMENENQAGCHNIINIIPIAYDQAFLPDYQGDVSSLKVYGYQEFPLFFNTGEAANIPQLKLFQQWFYRTNPNQKISLYALYGWVYGRMFEQAFLNAGKVINRQTFIAAMKRMNNFTADGLMPPADPSTKTSGTHCYILWELSNGQFYRVDDPSSGYRCDGKFLPRS